jgi:hypothetical protein
MSPQFEAMFNASKADVLPFGLEVAIQPFKGGKGTPGLAGVEGGGL